MYIYLQKQKRKKLIEMENLENKKFASCIENIEYAGVETFTKDKVYEIYDETRECYLVEDNYGDLTNIKKFRFIALWEK